MLLAQQWLWKQQLLYRYICPFLLDLITHIGTWFEFILISIWTNWEVGVSIFAFIIWTTDQVGAGHTKSSGAASDGIRGTKQVSVLLKRVLALLELCIVTYFGRLRNREWERMLSRKYAEAAFSFLSYEKCQMFFHRWFRCFFIDDSYD